MHPLSWKSSSGFITTEDICRSYLCIDRESTQTPIFEKKIGTRGLFYPFFGTPFTHQMPDFTGPRALSVPGEHRSELLRTITREKYIRGGSSNFGKHITRIIITRIITLRGRKCNNDWNNNCCTENANRSHIKEFYYYLKSYQKRLLEIIFFKFSEQVNSKRSKISKFDWIYTKTLDYASFERSSTNKFKNKNDLWCRHFQSTILRKNSERPTKINLKITNSISNF